MEDIDRADDAVPTAGARIALRLLAVIACALFIVGAVWFNFGRAFASLFNSDAAVPVLLAQEVLRTGNLLPATWYFGNDEIWTLSPHVFAMPFVAAFGVGTLAVKLGNLLCLGVMVLCLTLPLQRITRSWPYAILVATGVFAAFSGFQELAVYSQAAYGWFCAEFAILFYLALRLQEGAERPESERSKPWTIALYAFFLVSIAIDSPLRAAVYWVAPVIVTLFLSPISKARSRTLAYSTMVAFIGGAILHAIVSTGLLQRPGVTRTLLKPIGEWTANLATIAHGLSVLIGNEHWSFTLIDVLGVLKLFFFAGAAAIVLFAPVGNGPGSAECRFFARASGTMLLLVLIVMIVARVTVDPSSDRYLIPPMLLCLAALMTILWLRFRGTTLGITVVGSLFVITFLGGAITMISRHGPIAFNRACDAPGGICRLETAVAKLGIHHGYATYWKSNVLTVASNGDIRACGIFVGPPLTPHRWLVAKDCFDPPPGERFFIAFDRAEIASARRESLLQQVGTPDRIVAEAEYEIWIYTTAKARLDWLQR